MLIAKLLISTLLRSVQVTSPQPHILIHNCPWKFSSGTIRWWPSHICCEEKCSSQPHLCDPYSWSKQAMSCSGTFLVKYCHITFQPVLNLDSEYYHESMAVDISNPRIFGAMNQPSECFLAVYWRGHARRPSGQEKCKDFADDPLSLTTRCMELAAWSFMQIFNTCSRLAVNNKCDQNSTIDKPAQCSSNS